MIEFKAKSNQFIFYSKRSSIGSKKPKITPSITYESSESIFSLIKESELSEPCQIAGVTPISKHSTNNARNTDDAKSTSFTLTNADEIEENENQQVPTKYVPVDWSLKTKLRILCPTAVQGNGLKTSGASGITRYDCLIDE